MTAENDDSSPVRATAAATLMHAQVRAELDRITATYLRLAEQAIAESIRLGDTAACTPQRRNDA